MDHDYFLKKRIQNYELIRSLGSGGYASVYLGRRIQLENTLVAIKLNVKEALSREARFSFLQEARMMGQLHHEHILRLKDIGVYSEGGQAFEIPYLITEYARGGSLRTHLDALGGASTSLSSGLQILRQVGSALQFAHEQGIIHRDIKPENILSDEPDHILLADFGISVMISSSTTIPALPVGTLAYMSPEQFQGQSAFQSDQYALACVAYEMWTGVQPFRGSGYEQIIFQHLSKQPEPLRLCNPNISEQMEWAILKALSKRVDERFPSMQTFIEALAPSTEVPSLQASGVMVLSEGREDYMQQPISFHQGNDQRLHQIQQQLTQIESFLPSKPTASRDPVFLFLLRTLLIVGLMLLLECLLLR